MIPQSFWCRLGWHDWYYPHKLPPTTRICLGCERVERWKDVTK